MKRTGLMMAFTKPRTSAATTRAGTELTCTPGRIHVQTPSAAAIVTQCARNRFIDVLRPGGQDCEQGSASGGMIGRNRVRVNAPRGGLGRQAAVRDGPGGPPRRRLAASGAVPVSGPSGTGRVK